MSFILEALKGAEQKRRRKGVREHGAPEPQPSPSGPAADSPGWQVKMVSPCRYVRVKVEPGRTEDRSVAGNLSERVARGANHETVPDVPTVTEKRGSHRLLTKRSIAGAGLPLLLLLAGALAYHVWLRPAAITTNVNPPTARPEGAPVRPGTANIPLGQANDVVKPETIPARDAPKALGWSRPVTFRGAIARGLKIEMTLSREGSKLSGSYHYERIGTNIPVKGTIEENGSLVLAEFVKGHKTGVFNGKFVSDERIEGKWSLPDGTRSRDFFLVSRDLLRSMPLSPNH